jgi:hypothetical protein
MAGGVTQGTNILNPCKKEHLMNRIDEEFRKGFEMGMAGKDESELFLDNINIFRGDEEKRARQRGFEAGQKEMEYRKRGLR